MPGFFSKPRDESAPPCAPYLTPYRSAVDRVGTRFESLLWNSQETQRLRFDAITRSIDLRRRVILDAGCGRADFALWMREQRISWGRYIGVDAIPEMLQHCRALGLERAEFHAGDFVSDTAPYHPAGETPGVILFSGSLNTIPRTLSVQALDRAWAACGQALVFNFLSSSADDRPAEAAPGTAQKLSPSAMLQWALERTERVLLRQDYLDGRDATLVMWKAGIREG